MYELEEGELIDDDEHTKQNDGLCKPQQRSHQSPITSGSNRTSRRRSIRTDNREKLQLKERPIKQRKKQEGKIAEDDDAEQLRRQLIENMLTQIRKKDRANMKPTVSSTSSTTTILKDISTTSKIPVNRKIAAQQQTQQQQIEKQPISQTTTDASHSTQNPLLADQQKGELLRLNVLLEKTRCQYTEIKKKKQELQELLAINDVDLERTQEEINTLVSKIIALCDNQMASTSTNNVEIPSLSETPIGKREVAKAMEEERPMEESIESQAMEMEKPMEEIQVEDTSQFTDIPCPSPYAMDKLKSNRDTEINQNLSPTPMLHLKVSLPPELLGEEQDLEEEPSTKETTSTAETNTIASLPIAGLTATSETTVATTIEKSYGELRNTDTAHVQEILNEHVEKQQNGEQQNSHNQNCIEMAIEEVEVIEEQNELPNGQIEGNEENEGMVMETEEHQTICEEEEVQSRHEDEEAISMDMVDPFLMSIHAYRLSPNFPQQLIAHPAFSNRLDPFIPLCPYQLTGRCADQTCPFQHEHEYILTNQEMVEEIIGYWPKLCSRGMKPIEYANTLLANGPLDQVVGFLISSMPDDIRKLHFDARHIPSSSKPMPNDDQVEYEPIRAKALSMKNTVVII